MNGGQTMLTLSAFAKCIVASLPLSAMPPPPPLGVVMGR